MTSTHPSYSLLILAGGEGRRMGGQDKGLVSWQDRPLIEYVLAPYAEHAKEVLISCNRNIEKYAAYGETLRDTMSGFQGPLAGIYTGLSRARGEFLLVLPCDCPAPPRDLCARLYHALTNSPHSICCAYDGEREQYLFAMFKPACIDSLAAYLDSGGRSVKSWYAKHGYALADFSDSTASFANLNAIS